MKCSLFESAVVKVQQANSGSKKTEENKAIAGLPLRTKCTEVTLKGIDKDVLFLFPPESYTSCRIYTD